MDRGDAVKLFNDLMLFHALVDASIRWSHVTDRTVEATYTRGGER